MTSGGAIKTNTGQWAILPANQASSTANQPDSAPGYGPGREEKRATVRGAQNLLVTSGKEGSIVAGTGIPYVEWLYAYSKNYGYYAGTLKFKDVTTGFAVAPMVRGNTVDIAITPQASYITDRESGVIKFNRISTTVTVENGKPVVIGASPADAESLVTRFLGGIEKKDERTGFYMVLTATIEE